MQKPSAKSTTATSSEAPADWAFSWMHQWVKTKYGTAASLESIKNRVPEVPPSKTSATRK